LFVPRFVISENSQQEAAQRPLRINFRNNRPLITDNNDAVIDDDKQSISIFMSKKEKQLLEKQL